MLLASQTRWKIRRLSAVGNGENWISSTAVAGASQDRTSHIRGRRNGVGQNHGSRVHRRFASHAVGKPKDALSSTLHLYDSLTEAIQPLPQSDHKDNRALAWYTCGPTTYAPAHMGHARTYVWVDIIRRVLQAETKTGTPLFVMNITDVDDKILAAAADKEGPTDLARRMEDEFWRDLDALNCLRPHVVTRVTEYVESDIVPYIQRLLDRGMAYESDDGVYFHVRAYNERLGHVTKYGKLAPPSASQDIAVTSQNNNETASDPKKHDPRDFVLWKKKKPGEQLWWPSPFGEGRPGWHIECSAMIEAVQKQFQDTHRFLVHAGGVDLKFPHHSNEIAQSEAYRGDGQWIPHWVHTGHLHIDGLKMSKSLKNFVTIQEYLTAEFDNHASALHAPEDDFRLWCLGLSGKYRGPATFSKTRIAEASSIRERIVRFLIGSAQRIQQSSSATKRWSDEDQALFVASEDAKQECIRALRNDLDGATFVREIVNLSEQAATHLDQNHDCPDELLVSVAGTIRSLLALVGFSDKTTQAGVVRDGEGQDSSNVVGGERAMIDSFVEFRSLVRQAALEDVANKSASEQTNRILQLCDEYRDSVLPAIGVKIQDGSETSSSPWSFCLAQTLPSDKESTEDDAATSTPGIDLLSVRLEDFFRVGQYEGAFSEFAENGMPIRNSDGTEVSKRLTKKLIKKREAHQKRLEQAGVA